MMRPISIGAVLAVCGGAAFAQVDVPLLGYLPDSAHLRPVYGIPGAAVVAPPLDFGRDFGRIAVSPLQDYAIATDAGSGAVLLVQAQGSPMPLAGATANPSLIVMSPNGSSAALWFNSTGHAQIVSGLPGAPSLRELDASFMTAYLDDPALTNAPAALAVSDDGQWLAGSWPRGVYAFGPHGEVRELPMHERASALTFFAGRQDLALATAFHVFSIVDVGGSARVSTLYSGGRAIPAGIGVSSDNRRLVVAGNTGLLLSLDLNGGGSTQFDCGCAPDGVFSLGRGVFRVSGLAGGAFRILDASKGEILLVPLMAGQGGQP